MKNTEAKMIINPEAKEGFECEAFLEAHLLLNADEHGNAIYGLMIASALSLPFWFAIIASVGTAI